MKKIIISVIFLFVSIYLCAQEQIDTITAARKISFRNIPEVTGSLTIKTKEASKVISPLGEGDPIKYVQTLSGVSSGPEGSSAIYVRGSGSGNTILTIDGVPVYGITHILGLTTIVPQDVISDIQFYKDGFGNGLSGYTGSQLNLFTINADTKKLKAGLSLNTFLPGALVSMPLIKDKTSVLVSARYSPLEQEFSLAKDLFKKNGFGVDSLKTKIYDAFAKVCHKISDSINVYISGLYSNDGYNYVTENHSIQELSWSNTFVQFRLAHEGESSDWEFAAYYNNYTSRQEKRAYSNKTYNFLAAKSVIDEYNIRYNYNWHPVGNIKINGGFSLGNTIFKPGTNKVVAEKLSSSGKESMNTYKGVFFLQGIYSFLEGKALASLSVKGTVFNYDKFTNFGPEFHLSGRYNILPQLYADVSVSRTVQYSHTLEGMPLGWSTDLIVPSDKEILPEKASQYNTGLYFTHPKGTLYVGAYYKDMSHLVFYTDATELFGARRELWRDYLDFGDGTSKGLEMEYTFDVERFHFKGAYTLSKTDRHFGNTNYGKYFPAKYDRRHMFNASMEWVVSEMKKKRFSITGSATIQNGHWETVNADQYGVTTLEQIIKKSQLDFIVDHCSRVHNYRHPMYVRMDIGCRYEFGTDAVRHTLSIGVFNVLNRHNPFSIYYDTDDSRWKRLSLIPVLPNFSYKVQF